MGRYIAEGVRTDCKTIVDQFGKLRTLRYHIFTEIWRKMKFSYIYYGRKSFEELVEFTEEVLRIAKEFWLTSETLNEQTGGLYLLYGLYLKQPTEDMIKIRFSPDDCESIKKFQQEVKTGGHHDAAYVLARLFISDAFQFCATPYPHALEKCYRKYHALDPSFKEVGQEPAYINRIRRSDLFAKLEDAFSQYHKNKCNLVGPGARNPPQLLDYINPKAGHILHENLKELAPSSTFDNIPLPSSASETDLSKDIWWMVKTARHRGEDGEDSSDSDSNSDGDGFKEEIRDEKADNGDKRGKEVPKECVDLALGLSGDDSDGGSDTDSDCGINHVNNEILSVPSSSKILDMPNLM